MTTRLLIIICAIHALFTGAFAQDRNGQTYKVLNGTPVFMDIPELPVSHILSDSSHIVALSISRDGNAYTTSGFISVYSIEEEGIVPAGTLELPTMSIFDRIMLFPMDTGSYICGVSVLSANKFYGIAENMELIELKALAQKTKGHIFNLGFTTPVCLQDEYFYFLEPDDDSNYSLNRTEDDGTIKPVLYLDKKGSDNKLPYLGSATGNDGTIVFGYNFYNEIVIFDTGTGKSTSASFDDSGHSDELIMDFSGDILDFQRRYYGGYIHVGDRIFLVNLNGYIFASGEDIPNVTIDVFGRSGKPMERLLLDRSGHCAVDEQGGRIFLFTYGDNPQVYVYEL